MRAAFEDARLTTERSCIELIDGSDVVSLELSRNPSRAEGSNIVGITSSIAQVAFVLGSHDSKVFTT